MRAGGARERESGFCFVVFFVFSFGGGLAAAVCYKKASCWWDF